MCVCCKVMFMLLRRFIPTKMWYVVFTQNLTMLYFLTCAHLFLIKRLSWATFGRADLFSFGVFVASIGDASPPAHRLSSKEPSWFLKGSSVNVLLLHGRFTQIQMIFTFIFPPLVSEFPDIRQNIYLT